MKRWAMVKGGVDSWVHDEAGVTVLLSRGATEEELAQVVEDHNRRCDMEDRAKAERDGTCYEVGIPEGVVYDFVVEADLARMIDEGWFAWADGWDGRRVVNTRKGIEAAEAKRRAQPSLLVIPDRLAGR